MTDVSTRRSAPRRENRHDQAVLSGEVRRLVGVLRAGGPRQRASLQRISDAERWREGIFRPGGDRGAAKKTSASAGLQENNRSSEEPMSPEQQEHRNEPEQRTNAGYGQGQAKTPDEAFRHRRHGRFSDGQAPAGAAAGEHHGRFSEGQEQLDEHPKRIGHGGFGEGQRINS